MLVRYTCTVREREKDEVQLGAIRYHGQCHGRLVAAIIIQPVSS